MHHKITSYLGLAAFLSVIATIATDKLTRKAYANDSARNNISACKCRMPKIEVAVLLEKEEEKKNVFF